MNIIEIRKAKLDDVAALMDVNIQTWQTAYKGLINQEKLDGLDDIRASKIENYKEGFGKQSVDGVLIEEAVAIDNNSNKVVGFVTFGKYRDELDISKNVCELYAIYVLENFQGDGVGRALVNYAVKQLILENRYDSLIIWTLEKNQNRKFYEKLGGTLHKKKSIEIFGEKHSEVAYIFDNLVDLEMRTSS